MIGNTISYTLCANSDSLAIRIVMTATLTLIIPAYNEALSLPRLMPAIIDFCEKKGYSIILVDDGSTDATSQVLKDYVHYSHIKILHNKVNAGYGAAIKKAIRAATTDYVVTFDADGQHVLEDIEVLFQNLQRSNADMIVGRRAVTQKNYRNTGKWIIRKIAGLLMPLTISDINSGMKLYNTRLAKKYISICPNTMAYSDVILLAFVYNRHLVLEHPVTVRDRMSGVSTINTMTAVDTIKEIVNIVVLFNPMRIFFPFGMICIFISLLWEIPVFLRGNGLSVGALFGLIMGIMVLFFGLLAEQITAVRKSLLERNVRLDDEYF